MSLIFNKSDNLSVGVELELQLINLKTLDLAHDSGEILRRIKEEKFPGAIKPEVTQSMIEINSSIHSSINTLLAEFKDINSTLARVCEKIEIGISGCGAHPFQNWHERKVYPADRYKELYKSYGYLVKQFTVFGQHIHIGCETENDALKLCHGFIKYLPHFVALSASSPFFQNFDTEFDSSRLNTISSFPTSGIMPPLKTWYEFETYYDQMLRFGLIKDIHDLYWDIRPRPDYGTVEIRIGDTPLNLETAVALAAYAQALAAYLLDQPAVGDLENMYLVYKLNKFHASKNSFSGNIIDHISGEVFSLQEDITSTLNMLIPYYTDLNINDQFSYLYNRVMDQVNDAKLMREEYQKNESLQDLVRWQIKSWSDNG